MRSIADAVIDFVWGIVSVLLVPTILLLLLKRFVPVLGDALWRGYCQLLIWLVVAPVRVVRALINEVSRRR